jgi:TfoX/Sxy family transcriptional regulator of competence genes
MAYNEVIADRIREALVDLPDVEEKKMFRGITFMVEGKMCISVSNDELMCRIDPEIHDTVVEMEGCRSMRMKGREYKGYVLVGEEAIKTKKDFEYWVGLSLDFNKRAKSSKKQNKSQKIKVHINNLNINK